VTVTERAPEELVDAPESRRPAWQDADILLPSGTRIVHIGPHKTGTSGLQAALFVARARLERQGVYYASEGRHAMTAVLAGMNLPNAWGDDKEPPPRWKWERLLRKVRDSKADRVVISSEFFSDGKPDAIRKVIDELDPTRVHVVVTLRPLAKIIPSQWQQWVQNQVATPLDGWIRELLDKPGGNAGTTFWRRHRHDRLIATWAEVVGTDRVTAVALDDGDHDMVLRVFERLTGLTEGTLAPVTSYTNRSMTLPEIEVIRAFNKAYKAENLSRKVYTRVVRFGATALMESRVPSPDEPRIELPAWSLEPIGKIQREIIEGIRSAGVRVVGDLDGLDYLPPARVDFGGPVTVSPEVAATAAMGVLIASGLARGTGKTLEIEDVDEETAGPPLKAPPVVQEPAELLRLSSTQLQVVLIRRARAAVVEKIRPLLFWKKR
jgi:hypothetical protein